MALLVHSGTAAIDLDARYTARDDISDVLLASLSLENNLLGALAIGEEFAAEYANWVEDALNPFKVTFTASIASSAANSALTTTVSLSSADAAVLDIGYLLQQDSLVGVGGAGGDVMQVQGISGTTITVARNYGQASASAQSITTALMRIINAPAYPNSDLGKDLTKARIAKLNYINRWAVNVNIDSEQILRSRAGYVPGVRDELAYQFEQRVIEFKRYMSNALLYSKTNFGASTANGPDNDYQTMWGLIAMLNGTFNSTAGNQAASAITTGGVFSDTLVNTAIMNIYRQGGNSNAIIVGPNGMQDFGQLYQDRIRMDQSATDRGFYAQLYRPSMANDHYLLNEAYLNDTTGSGLLIVADLSRIRIRPFINSFSYIITAPSFRDGDAARWLSKWTLECRNTGTDAGYAHELVTSITW